MKIRLASRPNKAGLIITFLYVLTTLLSGQTENQSSSITIDSSQFNKGFIVSPEELLVGKIPGLSIISNSGMPGTSFTFLNKGLTSFHGSQTPLIIVDGFIMYEDLSIVNPDNIESITFLKNASEAAIFGHPASSGAIVITTKKAKVGDSFQVSYNTNIAFSTAGNFVDVYSGDEFRNKLLEHTELFDVSSYEKLGLSNTDWQNEIFRNTFSHNHTLALSGATKKIPYRLSLGYVDQNGTLVNTGLDKHSASLNINPTLLKDKLKINAYVKGLNSKLNLGDMGAIESAIFMDPTQVIMDGNEESGGYFQWENYGANLGTPNPVEQALEADNKSISNRLLTNIRLDYQLPFLYDEISEFKIKLDYGSDYSKIEGHDKRPGSSPGILTEWLNGCENSYYGSSHNSEIKLYLNYKKELQNKSKISAMAGLLSKHQTEEGETYTNGAYSSHEYESGQGGFFGQIAYDYMDRYLLSCILRNNYNSRYLSTKNSISLKFAWKIDKENFMKNNDAISNLRLRMGLGPYSYSNINKHSQIIFDLREDTKNINLGLDFGINENSITGSIEVSKTNSENLLISIPSPSASNFSNRVNMNGASMENIASLFSLYLNPKSQKPFNLTMGIHFSYNKNTVTGILEDDYETTYGIVYGDNYSGPMQIMQIGSPAYSYFVNQQVYDVNDNPIEGMYVDLSGEGGLVSGDYADMYTYNNPTPDLLAGISMQLNYKNIDISFSSRLNLGNYVCNQLAAAASIDQFYNLGYWRNQPTYLDNTNFVSRQFTSDYFIEDASYFKLDYLTIGYRFESNGSGPAIMTFLSLQNAITLSNYSGPDPEVANGIDTYNYPRPKIYSLGFRCRF